MEALNAAVRDLAAAAGYKGHPVGAVQWVPLAKVCPNDYNPNSVPAREMALLKTSIEADGYTQPVVTIYDREKDLYVIVDGFHRYTVMTLDEAIRSSTGGHLPVVVIDKPINDRMASTIRHNRARGKHSIRGMSSIVFSLLDNGWDDAAIMRYVGLSADELGRLKHITGFSKLFENAEYSKAWKTRKMIRLEAEWKQKEAERAG